MFLMKSLKFLLVELLFIPVSFNPCFRTVFGSKLLANDLFRDPKIWGGIHGSLGRFRDKKTRKKKVGKPVG